MRLQANTRASATFSVWLSWRRYSSAMAPPLTRDPFAIGKTIAPNAGHAEIAYARKDGCVLVGTNGQRNLNRV
jgi:hypothetical protein